MSAGGPSSHFEDKQKWRGVKLNAGQTWMEQYEIDEELRDAVEPLANSTEDFVQKLRDAPGVTNAIQL